MSSHCQGLEEEIPCCPEVKHTSGKVSFFENHIYRPSRVSYIWCMISRAQHHINLRIVAAHIQVKTSTVPIILRVDIFWIAACFGGQRSLSPSKQRSPSLGRDAGTRSAPPACHPIAGPDYTLSTAPPRMPRVRLYDWAWSLLLRALPRSPRSMPGID